ncbi:response regulator transcription factor [Schlegelella sp. S2-27]|uniref:Response regulator transcription factor n=1 Tax=Caldimonas mangrovi TaxID=2944811 RepID=A0ABT0YTA9_9BURK|nr:response regulator transcription factor [Caldimonas mangrovi]MCM5681512.1 response regulator transcription factor [Caldimonas mangrovi]
MSSVVEPAPISVLVVDDHPLLREGIAGVIADQPDMRLVGEATSGEEAIECFERLRPAVTLMDVRMAEMSGIDAMIAIRDRFPDARVIILTTYRGDVQAMRAIKAGAAGYLLKSMLRKELLETIRTVHRGQRCIPQEIAADLARHFGDDALSEREVGVLRLVAAGNSNKRIAGLLEISEETVKAHMRSILAKLGANDRTHAVTIALKRGIIEV